MMQIGELGRAAISVADRKTLVGAAKAFKFITLSSILLAAILVAGCATRTGATLEQLNKKIGGPGPTRARIVVIRPNDITVIDAGWKVYLDGAVMGDLKTGTFVYRDRRAGQHKLVFSRPGDFSRASTREFIAAPGRIYIFRLELNEKGQMVTQSAVAAGLAGMLISSAISDAADKRGFFDFKLLEGAEAQQALADIHLAPEEEKPR
jgi:hypothetical protein